MTVLSASCCNNRLASKWYCWFRSRQNREFGELDFPDGARKCRSVPGFHLCTDSLEPLQKCVQIIHFSTEAVRALLEKSLYHVFLPVQQIVESCKDSVNEMQVSLLCISHFAADNAVRLLWSAVHCISALMSSAYHKSQDISRGHTGQDRPFGISNIYIIKELQAKHKIH